MTSMSNLKRPFVPYLPPAFMFIQKGETAFNQSQSQHSDLQPFLSTTTQIQYL